MRARARYRIMREFRDKHKIGENLTYDCPDHVFCEKWGDSRCWELCRDIFADLDGCPCHVYGCATALRKLDYWLRKEKKRLEEK